MLHLIIGAIVFIFYILVIPEWKKYSREKNESRKLKEYLKREAKRIEKNKLESNIELEHRALKRMSEKKFPKSKIHK